MDVYEEMELDGVSPDLDTYGLFLDGCMKPRRVEDCMFFWQDFRKRGMIPNRSIYTRLVAGCGRSGAMDLAVKVRRV